MPAHFAGELFGAFRFEVHVTRLLDRLEARYGELVQIVDRDAVLLHDLCRDGVVPGGVFRITVRAHAGREGVVVANISVAPVAFSEATISRRFRSYVAGSACRGSSGSFEIALLPADFTRFRS